jgi:hypothetical protein
MGALARWRGLRSRAPLLVLLVSIVTVLAGSEASIGFTLGLIRGGIEKTEGSSVCFLKTIEVHNTPHNIHFYCPLFRARQWTSAWDIPQHRVCGVEFLPTITAQDFSDRFIQLLTLSSKRHRSRTRYYERSAQTVAPFGFLPHTYSEFRSLKERNSLILPRKDNRAQNRLSYEVKSGGSSVIHNSHAYPEWFSFSRLLRNTE